MKNFKNSLIILTLFLLSACLQQEDRPQDPIWGKQACDNCRMILSEKRFAAERILPNGRVFYYDDINCAVKHRHEGDEGVLYVRPFGGDNWALANEVKYESDLMTPMNSGYGAVKEGGTINFTEIKQKFEEK